MPINASLQMVTAEQLLTMISDDARFELIKGELQMMAPAGGRHGRLAHRVAQLLGSYVDQQQLGQVFAAETGFRIESNPDTVLAPDVAFVSQARFQSLTDDSGYIPFAPELAVEVLSPNDRYARVEAKALAWLDAGCLLVLVVDPAAETIHAYRSRQEIQIYHHAEIIDCSPAVPGWRLDLSQVFK